MDYWVNYPPTHILLRAYMGLGKDDEKPKNLDTATDEEMEEFMSACGGGSPLRGCKALSHATKANRLLGGLGG